MAPALISLVITPKTPADRQKLASALQVLAAEDAHLEVRPGAEPDCTVIGAATEKHLEEIIDRLKREFEVEASVGRPTVAYLETLTRPAEGSAKHVKMVTMTAFLVLARPVAQRQTSAAVRRPCQSHTTATGKPEHRGRALEANQQLPSARLRGVDQGRAPVPGGPKAELQLRLDAPEMPELPHPRMADVYRDKVGSLCRALENEESRTGAVEAIRVLVEPILLEPDGDRLNITLKGDLAGMLSAARPPSRAANSGRASASLAGAYGGGGDSKRSPDTGDLLVQIKLVAGACNPRYLQLWTGAA